MMRPTALNIVRFWLIASRPVTVQLPLVVGISTNHFTIAMQATIGLWTTITLVLFVQLADESRGLSHLVINDLSDDLAKTFAASWATLDKTNSQMTFLRLSISTSPSKVLQAVLDPLFCARCGFPKSGHPFNCVPSEAPQQTTIDMHGISLSTHCTVMNMQSQSRSCILVPRALVGDVNQDISFLVPSPPW
jgi:hypothetical protein